MSNDIPAEIIEIKNDVLRGMIEYIQPSESDDDFEGDYTKSDVDKCDSILSNYLSSVFDPSAHGNADKIMASVKTAVLALNDLNDECDGSLIETDQREGICELIISSAAQAGLESEEYDITGEWREW